MTPKRYRWLQLPDWTFPDDATLLEGELYEPRQAPAGMLEVYGVRADGSQRLIVDPFPGRLEQVEGEEATFPGPRFYRSVRVSDTNYDKFGEDGFYEVREIDAPKGLAVYAHSAAGTMLSGIFPLMSFDVVIGEEVDPQ